MTDTNNHETASDAEQHDSHGGNKKYFIVFLLLCGLTSLSFMTYFPFWKDNISDQLGWAIMMAVSCTKAMLVIMVFMHLWWEANWKYILTLPAAAMAVFLVCMLIPDIGMRSDHYNDYRWRYVPASGESDDHGAYNHDAEGHGSGSNGSGAAHHAP